MLHNQRRNVILKAAQQERRQMMSTWQPLSKSWKSNTIALKDKKRITHMAYEHNLLYAFLLTLLAGLSTGIGSMIAFFAKTTSRKFLSLALGFSAGIMIYVSLVEIFAKARLSMETAFGGQLGYLYTTCAFFGGVFLIAAIDKLIHANENPHEIHSVENLENPERETDIDLNRLKRMGVFTALAIAIHNFPEGFATLVAALQDRTLGLSIAAAIAIHNIPEGISISVPIYYATKSKRKAFTYSFLSGSSEPIGALVGYFLLRPYMSPALFGAVFAMIAGIMVFISLDELLPTAREYGEHHLSIYGLILGMGVMASSLVMFA
jgi:ZIP family zinc transporter